MGILWEKTLNPDADAFRQAHFLVLQHTTEVSPYIDEHKVHLRIQNLDRSEAWQARAHMKQSNIWFRDRIQNSDSSTDNALRSLAVSPLLTITRYRAYDINGYTFYTTAQDKKSTYQNSGLCIEVVDNEDEKIAYYGKIGDIWELNYSDFKVPVLRCC